MKRLKIAFFGDYYADKDGVVCLWWGDVSSQNVFQGRAGVIVYCLLDFFF